MTLSQKYTAYVNHLITSFPEYLLTKDDKQTLERGSLVNWITNKIIRKKFRKERISDELKASIRSKIAACVRKNEPVYLIITFGGYKHFWNPSYPGIDWAELFNLRFMCEYVSSILNVYKPGVILDYASDDVIIPLMNNYPKKALDQYAAGFKQLLKLYRPYFPKNLKINYVRSQDQYDTSQLFREISRLLPKNQKKFSKMSRQEHINNGFTRSPRNILWDGEENLTNLSPKEKQKKIDLSKIIEDTYYEADGTFRKNYLAGDTHITICLSWGLTPANSGSVLTLGSTYASSVDFWTGRGILEDSNNRIIPRIVSRSQYDAYKDKLVRIRTMRFPLRRFKDIEICTEKMEFNHKGNTLIRHNFSLMSFMKNKLVHKMFHV